MVFFPISIDLEGKDVKTTTVVDVRTFKAHEAKEVEKWSWRKFRHEKWIMYLNCVNNKIQIRKLK